MTESLKSDIEEDYRFVFKENVKLTCFLFMAELISLSMVAQNVLHCQFLLSSLLNNYFRTLCAELNMDEETQEVAWHSYNKTVQNYTLEGNKLHWLACALYVACRK